jgi:hypothetical protein
VDTTGELKGGIGRINAELLKAWPGLLYDNSRDYIMWGLAAAELWLPEDVTSMKGAQLQQLVLDLTADWHPNFHTMTPGRGVGANTAPRGAGRDQEG